MNTVCIPHMHKWNIDKVLTGSNELQQQITVYKAIFISNILIVSGVILENIIGV